MAYRSAWGGIVSACALGCLDPPFEEPVYPEPATASGALQAEQAPACAAAACTVAFVSGPDWSSYSGRLPPAGQGGYLRDEFTGPAMAVCVNPQVPSNCPAGAVVYMHPGSPGWAGGASLPRALWVWRGDVAANGPAAFQTAIFEKTVVVGDHPTGNLWLAVDDWAQVFVNGASVGTAGSIENVGKAWHAQNTLQPFDLTPALRPGANTIAVVAMNGPFACGSPDCSYTQAPAGVVFAGVIRW
jgi:hypothetical protein